MDSKKYYKHLDIIRILFCIAILFYHLNILKGGYLAVCSFFVLSGYLSCVSAFKKEKFSIKEYYLSRLKKIYLPLIIVVFITIPAVSLIKDLNWINLKPEVTSIIFGYNNFWQLSANLDYFARHVNSPFMHLWYVSILLQFDLIFPLIYKLLKQIGDKINKALPSIISIILAILSFVGFYLSTNMMNSYYNTFTRIFSILFGLSLGFIHCYYNPLIPKCLIKKPFDRFIFYIYSIILIILFLTIKSDSSIYKIIMLLTTFITCRLIDYSVIMTKNKLSLKNNIIKNISSICYEIYLVQYPVIFLFQYFDISHILKIILIIIITIMVSIIIHYSFSKNKNILKYIISFILIIVSVFGLIKYITVEDHTKEMKQLEEQLAQNEDIMKKRQEEYELNYKKEQEKLQKLLEEYTTDKNKINEMISSLSVIGIGDSVMLGAVEDLSAKFPNGYFDGKVSRSGWVVNGILEELKANNMLGDPIVINVGTNGDCPESVKNTIMNTLEGREVFWLTVTNDEDVHVNDRIKKYAEKYPNLHIIDWEEISKGHSEYFYADGIHLTTSGRKAYIDAIYNAIYEIYYKKFNAKRDEILKQHEEELKNKITFFGNDLLINTSGNITIPSDRALFITNKDYDFNSLKKEISDSIKNETLNYKVVFAFDNQIRLKKEEYQELFNLCNEHEIYVISLKEETTKMLNENFKNINIIDFSNDLKNHDNYLMVDKTHLSNEGNIALCNIINDLFNSNKEIIVNKENVEAKEDMN